MQWFIRQWHIENSTAAPISRLVLKIAHTVYLLQTDTVLCSAGETQRQNNHPTLAQIQHTGPIYSFSTQRDTLALSLKSILSALQFSCRPSTVVGQSNAPIIPQGNAQWEKSWQNSRSPPGHQGTWLVFAFASSLNTGHIVTVFVATKHLPSSRVHCNTATLSVT